MHFALCFLSKINIRTKTGSKLVGLDANLDDRKDTWFFVGVKGSCELRVAEMDRWYISIKIFVLTDVKHAHAGKYDHGLMIF